MVAEFNWIHEYVFPLSPTPMTHFKDTVLVWGERNSVCRSWEATAAGFGQPSVERDKKTPMVFLRWPRQTGKKKWKSHAHTRGSRVHSYLHSHPCVHTTTSREPVVLQYISNSMKLKYARSFLLASSAPRAQYNNMRERAFGRGERIPGLGSLERYLLLYRWTRIHYGANVSK